MPVLESERADGVLHEKVVPSSDTKAFVTTSGIRLKTEPETPVAEVKINLQMMVLILFYLQRLLVLKIKLLTKNLIIIMTKHIEGLRTII